MAESTADPQNAIGDAILEAITDQVNALQTHKTTAQPARV